MNRSTETVLIDKKLEYLRENHKEISITVRRTMFTLLAYSASCFVIIAQPDIPFIVSSSGVQIPVLNTAINLKAFLLFGPLCLIGITSYLYIFLCKLNRITDVAYYEKKPFIFNFSDNLSKALTLIIFYGLPTFVMIGFSWKAGAIEWNNFLCIATGWISVCIWLLYLKNKLNNKSYKVFRMAIITAMSFTTLLLLFGYIEYKRNLNLERAQLSNARLNHAELFKANFTTANLENADLTHANLNEATLSGANLRGAILHTSQIKSASLILADLQGADLSNANLVGSILYQANLSDAKLNHAFLTKANLGLARLTRAKVRWGVVHDAYLQKADLSNSDFRNSWIIDSILIAANLSQSDFRYADLTNSNLEYAELYETKFNEAKLINCNLTNGLFYGAVFEKADLMRANFSKARFLTVDQLCSAGSLYETILEQELMEQIENKCPQLLNVKIEFDILGIKIPPKR
jgi:uncharacterized protein YjbI with pentapeptide repeats